MSKFPTPTEIRSSISDKDQVALGKCLATIEQKMRSSFVPDEKLTGSVEYLSPQVIRKATQFLSEKGWHSRFENMEDQREGRWCIYEIWE